VVVVVVLLVQGVGTDCGIEEVPVVAIIAVVIAMVVVVVVVGVAGTIGDRVVR